MQINTMTNSKEANASKMISVDAEKELFKEKIADYLSKSDVEKRMKNIIGRSTRFNVNLDELRKFNPKLANFVVRNPIEAVKLFEDQLNSNIKNFQEGD